jgi:hypothetical protein
MRRIAALLGLLVLGSVVATRAPAGATSAPLIGVNYTHFAFPDCSLDDTAIVLTYDEPGIRTKVRRQLAAMRAAGIQTLRLLLWHVTDAGTMRWGVVSSGGGSLGEPYRSNLIHYLGDVRRAGFERLTLVFAPEGANNPLGGFYDPATFDENWAFIRDVRPLLKEYGPASTRVDLINEGAPPAWESPDVLAEAEAYITKMWSNYVDAFGGEDASFSSVGADGPYDTAARMQNLVDALRASGRPLPSWFDVHPPYDRDGMLAVLRAVDSMLTAYGLSQPLVIGETAYDDAGVASAIAQFRAESARPILEVMAWPLRAGRRCSVSAPYRADAYVKGLTGSAPPATLQAIVTRSGLALRTSYGDAVTALEAGRYTVRVRDGSASRDFHLVGPGVDRRTGLVFTGRTSWSVELKHGTYRYRSDRARATAKSFVVLTPG